MRVRARGEQWTIAGRTDFEDCSSLRLTGCGLSNSGVDRTLLVPFDRVVELDDHTRVDVLRPRRWLHRLRGAGACAHPRGGLRAAASATIDILPYQLAPALAVLDGATRILIADDVGLGKTVQAGLVLAELAARTPELRALVAVPAGLRAQWTDELGGRLRLSATAADSAWLAARTCELPPGVNPWGLPGIFVTSYDLLKRPEVLRALEDLLWDAVVIDEAHNAAPGTARRAALHAVALRARHVLLLTATPHAGEDESYEALARIGTAAPDDEPLAVFRRGRVGARRRTVGLRIRPTAGERRMHRRLAAYLGRLAAGGVEAAALLAAVFRKRALSSAHALAASIRRRIELLQPGAPAPRQLALPLLDEDPLDDGAPEAVLASAGLEDTVEERRLLERLLEAAAGVTASKAGALARLLRRIHEPAIVFTEFRDTLTWLKRTLAAHGLTSATVHGGMTPEERAEAVRAFSREGRLLLATDAAAEGLNLQARCRLVVHYDLPWMPTRLEQRAGRVDRIGQSRRVHEILLLSRHPAERTVTVRLEDRRRRIGAALGRLAAVDDDRERVEAERLCGCRGVTAAAPHRAGRSAAVRRGRRAPALICVYRLSLQAPPGVTHHAQLVAVQDDGAVRPRNRSGRAVRAATSAWVAARERDTRSAAVARSRAAVSAIAGAHRGTIDRLLRRERRMADAAGPAAARLVQRGLFDRRAERDAESREHRLRDAGASAAERQARLERTRHLGVEIQPAFLLWTAEE